MILESHWAKGWKIHCFLKKVQQYNYSSSEFEAWSKVSKKQNLTFFRDWSRCSFTQNVGCCGVYA